MQKTEFAMDNILKSATFSREQLINLNSNVQI